MTDVNMQGFQADHGGAILLLESTASVTAATFTDNTAGANGGAIALVDSTARIIQAMFVNNAANSNGGALFVLELGEGNNVTLRQVPGSSWQVPIPAGAMSEL
jgi:predicted outer membrane repeat protein